MFIELKAIPVLGRTSYLVIPDDQENISEVIKNLKIDLDLGKKIRIIWENKTFSKLILGSLEELGKTIENLNFQPYETVFYKLKLSEIGAQIKNYPEVNWERYSSKTSFKLVKSVESPDYEIVKNFVLNSNGVEFSKKDGITIIEPNQEMQKVITEKLPEVIGSSENNIYLVSNNIGSQFVGCFDLVKVNTEEVQLHYTSGKASKLELFLGKKMPILTAAILEILKTEYKDYKYLTFSNKDKATKNVYQDVGFQVEPERKCILVKKNLSNNDVK